MKTIFICFTLTLIFFPGVLISQNKFKPWNPEVSVGDENIAGKNKISEKNIKVFGGPQAGAYFMIRLFQIFISPQDGPNCRFSPTCSGYGRIAVLKYGALAGSFLAGDRLIRCNPFNEPGEDPVPEFLFKQAASDPITLINK